MIDLHCHLLPGIDDGAPDIEASIAMARIAVADGIDTIACTPHIMEGVYRNDSIGIRAAVERLRTRLFTEGITLALVEGADIHISPRLVERLLDRSVPTIGGTRYFLIEPPHHVAPVRLGELLFSTQTAGFVPILTHPERLSWIESHYSQIQAFARAGVLMQITAGSVLGRFGDGPKNWALRMLSDRIVDVMASDAHHYSRRTPRLSAACRAVSGLFGEPTATRLVATVPQLILKNVLPSKLRQS